MLLHVYILSVFFFSFTDTHDSKGKEGTCFIPLYHFYMLRDIQTFICNFACEMTTTYFSSHCLQLPDCYLMSFMLTDWWCNVCFCLFTWWFDPWFLLQQFDGGNLWILTHINYHPCITSEPVLVTPCYSYFT